MTVTHVEALGQKLCFGGDVGSFGMNAEGLDKVTFAATLP